MGLLGNSSYFFSTTSLEIRGADKEEGLPPCPQNTSGHPESMKYVVMACEQTWPTGNAVINNRQCQERQPCWQQAGAPPGTHHFCCSVLQCCFFHPCQPHVRCCRPVLLMALPEQCTILAHFHAWWVGFHRVLVPLPPATSVFSTVHFLGY